MEENNNITNLKKMAYYDGLTNLKNRKAFERDIAKLDARNITIVAVDANNLKKMNDTFGHEMGDKLIIAVANVLAEIFGRSNSYRTGGDEYLAILESKDDELITRIKEVFKKKLEEENAKVKGSDLIISAAIGFSKGGDGKSINQMMREADAEMYEDKHEYKIEQKTKDDKAHLKGVIDKEYDKKLIDERKYTKKVIIGSIVKSVVVTILCIVATNLIT